MTTPEYFGKRPNWILKHPTMRGNAYAQAIYTHLRGMPPQGTWKSERALARSVSDDTGFTESVCRKTISTLKSSGFITFTACGKLEFGTEETVTSGYPGSQIGYGGSQSGYGGSHYNTSEQELCAYREVESREILELEGIGTTSLYLEQAANDVHEGGTVILGADGNSEWEAPAKPPRKSNETLMVFDHFNFAARRTGSTPVKSPAERAAFMSQIKRLLATGHTVVSLREMIEVFFQNDRFRNHQSPWKLFCSQDIQRTLTPNAPLRIHDEVLAWVANDFVREASLPWPEEFDTVFRTLVLRRGLAVAYRYPDLLASIAHTSHADADTAELLLATASTLIDQLLNEPHAAHLTLITQLRTAGVVLPKDLTVSKHIRKEAMTLREAVLAIPRS